MAKTNQQLVEDLMSLSVGLGVDSEASDVVLEAIARILKQEGRIDDLEAANSDMGWRLNPDRMGGQYSEYERRRSEEWR